MIRYVLQLHGLSVALLSRSTPSKIPTNEKEIGIFVHEKKRSLAVVANSEWQCIWVVGAGLTNYMSDFNSRLHGETETYMRHLCTCCVCQTIENTFLNSHCDLFHSFVMSQKFENFEINHYSQQVLH